MQCLEVALGRCGTADQFWQLMGEHMFPRLDHPKMPTSQCLEIGRVCAQRRERIEASAPPVAVPA